MSLGFQPPNPELANTNLYLLNPLAQKAAIEGDHLFHHPVPLEYLYQPEFGHIDHPKVEILEGGITRYSTTYLTVQAMHNVRFYKAAQPENHHATPPKPNVIVTGATGTGSEGHNEKLARQIAATGCNVIFKGVPRYFGPRKALTLTEDANEMHGLLNALASFKQLNMGSLERVHVYGESQAAMKLLGFIALSESYNREVVDGMAVAICYLEKAPYNDPRKLLSGWASLAKSTLSAVLQLSPYELWQAGKTLDRRDLHHHFGVIPALLSGEAGNFLPHIPRTQTLTNKLFASDEPSQAVKTKSTLDAHFPNMNTTINEDYGHVDGIISAETAEARRKFFENAAQVTVNS